MPDDTTTRKWFNELWTMGIKAGPDVLRTFVVEDLSQNKLVAMSRWHVPRSDGKQETLMPAVPGHWDPEITKARIGGMTRSRACIMGQKPHWLTDFTAIDPACRKRGLVFTFADWGIRQANATGLEIFGNAGVKGLPVWKHYGCEERGEAIRIPGRSGYFDTYTMVPLVWKPNTKVMRSTAKL